MGACVPVQSLGHVWLFVSPWTAAHQAPLSMDFPGKNTGVGCHFLLQGIFPNPGIKPASPASAGKLFYHWATWWKPQLWSTLVNFLAPKICPTKVLNGVRCQESNAPLPCQSLTRHSLCACTRLFSLCRASSFPLCCWREMPIQLLAAGTADLMAQTQTARGQSVSLWALNSGKDPFSPQIYRVEILTSLLKHSSKV